MYLESILTVYTCMYMSQNYTLCKSWQNYTLCKSWVPVACSHNHNEMRLSHTYPCVDHAHLCISITHLSSANHAHLCASITAFSTSMSRILAPFNEKLCLCQSHPFVLNHHTHLCVSITRFRSCQVQSFVRVNRNIMSVSITHI